MYWEKRCENTTQRSHGFPKGRPQSSKFVQKSSLGSLWVPLAPPNSNHVSQTWFEQGEFPKMRPNLDSNRVSETWFEQGEFQGFFVFSYLTGVF